MQIKFINDVCMAGLPLPTSCRPREPPMGLGLGLGLVGLGLGSSRSGPTCKVEIDHTRRSVPT